MIITKSDLKEITNPINRNKIKINNWFKSNSLSLNIDKTFFLQFHKKTKQKYDFQTSYENRKITKAQNIKFLGIIIDSNLSWKKSIDDIIPKFNKACFAVRTVESFMSLEVMRMICFSYFHSDLSYRIIFCGNSVHRKYIFKFKREQFEILQLLGKEICVRTFFKKLQVLQFYPKYIYAY